MRCLLILTMLATWIGSTHADELPAQPPGVDLRLSPRVVPEDELPGRGKYVTGAVLIAFGAISTVGELVGIGLMSRSCPGDIDQNNCYLIPGAYTAGLSALAASIQLGVGIPLLVSGKREMQRARSVQLTGVSATPLLGASQTLTGGTLGLTFKM